MALSTPWDLAQSTPDELVIREWQGAFYIFHRMMTCGPGAEPGVIFVELRW